MDAIFILSSSHNIMYTDYVHIHCPVGHRGDVNEMNSLELKDRKNLPRKGICISCYNYWVHHVYIING